MVVDLRTLGGDCDHLGVLGFGTISKMAKVADALHRGSDALVGVYFSGYYYVGADTNVINGARR